jgi:hypothetical protein
MCPKAKADQVITHRIEFQETERDALEMVAASITARNVSATVNNLVTPFTTATVAGVAWSLSILGVLGLALSEKARKAVLESGESALEGALWQAALGPVWGLVNSLSDDKISNKFESIMSNINDKYI